MKKPLILVAILAIVAVTGFILVGCRDHEPPSSEPVVFDLRYRGLTVPDDGVSYRAFWGFGASPPVDVPFVETVKKQVQEFDIVHNGALADRQWSLVELKEKKPVALYFDLDGDGKLSRDEKILPTASSKPKPEHEFAFITPDFLIRQEDGRQIPFRVMLVADSYGGDQMNYMWSPCCILEGQATFAGEPMRLFLYGEGFSGSFTTFGRCSFALVQVRQALERLEGYLPRATLSSLICHNHTFYRLKFDGAHEKDKTVRVTLTRDTGPTGRMAANIDIKETDGVVAHLSFVRIQGAEDTAIHFNLADMEFAIPVGRYRLASGNIGYESQDESQWRVNFNDSSPFNIDADKTAQVELGTLALSVSAVNENERYQSDVKEKATYARGTPIYLTPQIKGQAGEVYLRFSQQRGGGDEWTDLKPHLTILNAAGKEIVSADMEYG